MYMVKLAANREAAETSGVGCTCLPRLNTAREFQLFTFHIALNLSPYESLLLFSLSGVHPFDFPSFHYRSPTGIRSSSSDKAETTTKVVRRRYSRALRNVGRSSF
jgi:hypothetical protein